MCRKGFVETGVRSQSRSVRKRYSKYLKTWILRLVSISQGFVRLPHLGPSNEALRPQDPTEKAGIRLRFLDPRIFCGLSCIWRPRRGFVHYLQGQTGPSRLCQMSNRSGTNPLRWLTITACRIRHVGARFDHSLIFLPPNSTKTTLTRSL